MNWQTLSRGLAVLAAAGALLWWALSSTAQPTSTSALAPPPNGPRRLEPASGHFAIVNATVYPKPGAKLEGATVVIRDGVITDVIEQAPDASKPAKAPELPASVRVEDGTGMHVYAGFIEPYVEVDAPRPDMSAPGSHWNPRITPQRTALDRGARGVDEKTADTLRSMGFVAAAISPKTGLVRGTGAVVSLARASADPSDARPRVYADRVFQAMSFDASGDFGGGGQDDARWVRYPDSQMGAIALIRQTLIDADAQAREREAGAFKETVNALDALRPALKIPTLWDTADELESLRGLAISKEFARTPIVLGSGREYRRLAALVSAKAPLIVPLNYPARPRVGSIGEADSVDLGTLIAWEQAPTNPRRLDAAGLTVALTTGKVPDKLGGRGGFRDRLALALKHGLPGDKALAMLTTNPAGMLGVSGTLGTIEKGKAASFVIADGPLFVDRPDAPKPGEDGYIKPGKIIDVWIDGIRHPIAPKTPFDLEGTWTIKTVPEPKIPGVITLAIEEGNKITVIKETTDAGKKTRSTSKARDFDLDQDGRFSFVFDHDPFGEKGVFVNTGVVERGADGALVMHATAVRTGGETFSWSAVRTPKPAADAAQAKKEFKPTPGALAGTWTLVIKDGVAKPDDPQHPTVYIGGDKSISVKRADDELKVTDVTFDMKEEGTDKLVSKIRYTVVGLTPDQASVKVVLTPTADRGRLSGSTKEDGGESFQLARSVPTPEADEINTIPERLGLPVGPFAMKEIPEQGSVLVANATVWTSGPAGIIENGFVAFQGGKITLVASSMPSLPGEWTVIDAKGKHLTPGIIDCHSHTGISKGVNESGQAVTAEVRIGDVTDPDSISWYRQLAGGVTAVSSLHGSANPIGGQNQVNKVRWGVVAPSDMHFEGAISGIKFALGENVKQSNWGERSTTRYPQTRMGVETLIRDRFTTAQDYARSWSAYAAAEGADAVAGLPQSFRGALAKFPSSSKPEKGSVPAPRRDLELEALAEILGGTRLVHCHSYRQDEILMLTRVARDFGFRIGTFQHILEGYKVADAVRDYAIGASAFSDWWNFKVEVQDAIPYAGPIMHEVGVVVSYNSDSDELARRLNVEAGKALKYGGKSVTPAEALKFVTLNPARQLKIDDKVGSIEVGKHADLVLWSGPPMSSMSRAERTWVDGRLMFSLERDAELRKANAAERQRLIQKILAQEKREKGGGSTSKTTTSDPPKDDKKPAAPSTPPSDLDQEWMSTLADARAGGRSLILAGAIRQAQDARREIYLDMLRRGVDPRWGRMGECGCEVWQQSGGAW